jgi:hypothetical protein
VPALQPYLIEPILWPRVAIRETPCGADGERAGIKKGRFVPSRRTSPNAAVVTEEGNEHQGGEPSIYGTFAYSSPRIFMQRHNV